MKALIGIVTILLALATAGTGISWGLRNYLYNVRVGQYLRLADDASLPVLKRDYLIKYKDVVNRQIHREDGRYWFKQERLTRTAQLGNLDSLIKRLDDIALMTPDSLAYQQGMQQIAGQEFDHTLGEINGVFFACYTREAFFSRFAISVVCITFGILAGISGFVLMIAVSEDW